MKLLTITEEMAKTAFDLAPVELKPVFEALLGKRTEFKTYTDVQTLEDAYKLFPPTPDQQWVLEYKGNDPDVIAAVSFLEITIFVRAVNYVANGNKLWEPDFENIYEWKYTARLEYKADSGFSDSDDDASRTGSAVGSRLSFINGDVARYTAIQINKQYNRMFILNNINI